MYNSIVTLLFLFTFAPYASSQGVVYVGDLDSVDRAVLNAPVLPTPLSERSARNPVLQVDHRAAQGQAVMAQPEAPPKQAKAERGTIFGRMVPSWMRGDKPTQQTQSKTRDPFLTTPARTASPIAAYATSPAKPITNAAYTESQSMPKQVSRGGGISMRRTTPQKGLFDHLGLTGSSAKEPQAAPVSRAPQRSLVAPSKVTRNAPTVRAPLPKKPMPRPSYVSSTPSFTKKRGTVKNAPTSKQGLTTLLANAKKRPAEKKPISVNAATKQSPTGKPYFISDQPKLSLPASPSQKPVTTSKASPRLSSKSGVGVSPQRGITSVRKARTNPKKRVAVPNPYPFTEARPIETRVKAPSERSRVLLSEAHNLAAYAVTHEEYSAIIQRCRYVLAIDDAPQAVGYANQLAGWSLNKRGELLLDQVRSAEATIDFKDALRCDNDCWRAEHNLGVLDAQAGNYESARQRFDRTLELNPEFAKAYTNRAALHVQSGQYPKALEDYSRAIDSDPDMAIAHSGRGRVCHMLGRLDEALQHLDAAALLASDDAAISLGRGDLLVDLGRYGQARRAYERAIELDTSLANAYRNLAWMLATCPNPTFRDGEAAVLNAQHAKELSGEEDDIALDTQAAALAATGEFDQAIRLLNRAIEIAPKQDAAVYRKRLALYEKGESFLSQPATAVQPATYVGDQKGGVQLR